MDFIDKKEQFADSLEAYVADSAKKEELLSLVNDFSFDQDFKGKELFMNIFSELKSSLDELSRRELKQRILMVRSFLE